MIYHWDGYEPFRLTHRGPPIRTYNVSGRSLVVLNRTVNGALASFSKPLRFDQGVSASALLSGRDVVMQVRADPGWQNVSIGELQPPALRNARVTVIDALTGTASARDDVALASSEGSLHVRFKVPERVNGANGKSPKHLAYIVLRGVA
jgi:hypothetical protein